MYCNIAMPQVIKLSAKKFGWVHSNENEYNLRGFKKFYCVLYPQNVRLLFFVTYYIRQKISCYNTLSKTRSLCVHMFSPFFYCANKRIEFCVENEKVIISSPASLLLINIFFSFGLLIQELRRRRMEKTLRSLA